MHKKQFHLLLHPLFLINVFVLLLNDIYLKYAFGNWLTGKLSDFTGLFGFSIFLIASFPGRKIIVLLFSALFFIWWKSPLSQSLIESFNAVSSIRIDRVIDYSDLLALLVLPIAWIFSNKAEERIYKSFLIRFSCLVSLFAFCNTSMPRYGLYYIGENNYEFNGAFRSSRTENEILADLGKNNISFFKDSVVYLPLRNRSTGFQDQRYSSEQMEIVLDKKDSSLFRKQQEKPFYIIPDYTFEGKVIHNIKLRISEFEDGKKIKSWVYVNFIEVASYSDYRTRKSKRKYIKHFKEFFN